MEIIKEQKPSVENVGKAYMLSVVEQRIREDIPRLKELREGCIIKNNYNGDLEIFLGYISVDGFSRAVLKDLHTESIRLDIQGSIIIDEFNKYAYSIIGHDIMLNDVLEWLFNNKIQPHGVLVFWDLPSLCLKDQSEELIKFLYTLKTQIK